MLVAAVLTVVVLLGYGGYTAWNAVSGGGDEGATTPTAAAGDADYETIVSTAIFLGAQALAQGADTHLAVDLGPFADGTDRAIFTIGADRARLARLARTAAAREADVIVSTEQSLDALQTAMVQWRDAVFNLRLGAVDDARAAVDSAIARLQGDLERWRSVSDSS